MHQFIILMSCLSLKVLSYPLISGNIKTNGLITSPKNAIKYFELFFILIKFEITILSTSTSQIFGVFFSTIFFFCYFCLIKKFCSYYFLADL